MPPRRTSAGALAEVGACSCAGEVEVEGGDGAGPALGKYLDVTVGAGLPMVRSRPLRVPPLYPTAPAFEGAVGSFDRAGGLWKYL